MSQFIAPSPAPSLAPARRQLHAVARRYAGRQALRVLLPAGAGGLVLLALARSWPATHGVALGGAALLLMIGWLLWPLRLVRPATIAPRLDRQFAELEDSTGLLLRRPEELNLLELLQQQRVARRLEDLRVAQKLMLPVPFQKFVMITALLLLTAAAAWRWPARQKPVGMAGVAVHFSQAPRAVAGRAAAHIIQTQILVTPPAYTRQPAFRPAQASFSCPARARVRWLVRVSGGTGREVPELEIGRERLRLQAAPGQPGSFLLERMLTASTLYRLRLGGTVSDDYAIEVRADQAPVLRIIMPKPYTLVAAIGQRSEVAVQATVRDDYGLSRAELVITVAQGQGEAVKFREVRRELSAGLSGQPRETTLRNLLNLRQLGLTYGDELYFYLAARDNAGHFARTDAYLVQWQDTAVADSPADLGVGVKVAPAYFRSQRQIIIDTEKLLAGKPKLDDATVASRANALGFDQQTLRLRYGKFMGEEAEAGIGVDAAHSPIAEDEDEKVPAADRPAPTPTAEADDHHDHAAPPSSKASPTAEIDALMESYIHRHDAAETADFLEPAVKAKLRAVLDQMWAAELRLRTGQLKAALPYEYRALRLFKQVQQQTRAYVKKAGFVAAPLPEATVRLTGELVGAVVPHRQQTLPAPAAQPEVRAALRWLTAQAAGRRANPADAHVLDQAGALLAGAALQRPGVYLPALRALRELVDEVRAGRPPCAACRAPVERALTDLLAAPAPAPPAPAAPDRLARRYFQELSR